MKREPKRFYTTGPLGGPYKVVDREMTATALEGFGVFYGSYPQMRTAAKTLNGICTELDKRVPHVKA